MIGLISERGVNQAFLPIEKKRGNDLSNGYKVNASHGKFESEKNCTWDVYCFNLMDYLATECQLHFESIIKKKHNISTVSANGSILQQLPFSTNVGFIADCEEPNVHPKDLETLRGTCKPFKFSRTSKEMLKSLPLKGMSTAKLRQTINKIATCNVKTSYSIKTIINSNGNRKKTKKKKLETTFQKKYQNKYFSPLFFVEEKQDQGVYGSTYTFNFDTILGTLFTHNIMSQGYSIIKPELAKILYSLSPNANLIFRRYLIHLNRMVQKTLKIEEIVTDLGIRTNVDSVRKNMVVSWIRELETTGLIEVTNMDLTRYHFLVRRGNIENPKKPKKKSHQEQVVDLLTTLVQQNQKIIEDNQQLKEDISRLREIDELRRAWVLAKEKEQKKECKNAITVDNLLEDFQGISHAF